MSSKEFFLAGVFLYKTKVRVGPGAWYLLVFSLPPAPLIGHELCSLPLSQDDLRESAFPRKETIYLQVWVRKSPQSFLTHRDSDGWKWREGRPIFFFFLLLDLVAMCGERHCGGRKSLTVFKLCKKKQKKTTQKKQKLKAACLISLGKAGPLSDFWELGGRPRLA